MREPEIEYLMQNLAQDPSPVAAPGTIPSEDRLRGQDPMMNPARLFALVLDVKAIYARRKDALKILRAPKPTTVPRANWLAGEWGVPLFTIF